MVKERMHPEFISLGQLEIRWYGVMMAAGFFAGLLNWVWLGKNTRRDFNYCSDLLFWIMVSGIAGARLAHVFANLPYFLKAPWKIFYLHQGGLIYYGGFLGAGVAIVIFSRAKKDKLLALFDFVITAVPLAHVFGRIGCFLNGCCYGILCNNSLGVVYPKRTQPWYDQVVASLVSRFDNALPVHAVQLYESLFNLVLYFFIIWIYRRRRGDGYVLVFYLLAYPVARFSLEFLRGDVRMMAFGLSVAQVVSITLFVLGCGILARIKINEHRKSGTGGDSVV